MKQPTKKFLRELARALQEAEHQNVAGRFMAGALWAMYPDWFDSFIKEKQSWDGIQNHNSCKS